MNDDKPAPTPEHAAAPEPGSPSAADRLRAFEDAKLGPNAPRYNGEVEKGHGSFFKSDKLTDADRAHHAALEQLVEAEKKVSDAQAALSAAERDHADAERRVEISAPPAPEPAPEPAPAPAPVVAPAPEPAPAV